MDRETYNKYHKEYEKKRRSDDSHRLKYNEYQKELQKQEHVKEAHRLYMKDYYKKNKVKLLEYSRNYKTVAK